MSVFVLGAVSERALGERIESLLRQHGFETFGAYADTPHREPLGRRADCVILLWSQQASASGLVQQEITFAERTRVPIVGLRIDDTSLGGRLRGRPLPKWPDELSEDALIQAVRRVLSPVTGAFGPLAPRPPAATEPSPQAHPPTDPSPPLAGVDEVLKRAVGVDSFRRPAAGFGPAPRQSVHFRCGLRRAAAPAQELSARFVAYPPSAESYVKALLRGVDERAEARPERSVANWALGTVATVSCRADWLSVDPPEQTFEWRGEPHALDFDLRVAADAPRDTSTRLKFDVAIDGIVVARLRVDLRIAAAEADEGGLQMAHSIAASTAFASYASEDRARVLDRVASVRTAAGIDVWLDCVNLRPNERWRELLGPAIAQRELFLLFWSEHAAASQWVDWEWRCALQKKGLDAMQLHPLENAAATLPAELRALHATDPLMDIRDAELRRRP